MINEQTQNISKDIIASNEGNEELKTAFNPNSTQPDAFPEMANEPRAEIITELPENMEDATGHESFDLKGNYSTISLTKNRFSSSNGVHPESVSDFDLPTLVDCWICSCQLFL